MPGIALGQPQGTFQRSGGAYIIQQQPIQLVIAQLVSICHSWRHDLLWGLATKRCKYGFELGLLGHAVEDMHLHLCRHQVSCSENTTLYGCDPSSRCLGYPTTRYSFVLLGVCPCKMRAMDTVKSRRTVAKTSQLCRSKPLSYKAVVMTAMLLLLP